MAVSTRENLIKSLSLQIPTPQFPPWMPLSQSPPSTPPPLLPPLPSTSPPLPLPLMPSQPPLGFPQPPPTLPMPPLAPPCADLSDTGYTIGDAPASCAQLQAMGACHDVRHGMGVTASCRASCGMCVITSPPLNPPPASPRQPCEDSWRTSRCLAKRSRGKCTTSARVLRRCQLTCESTACLLPPRHPDPPPPTLPYAHVRVP